MRQGDRMAERKSTKASEILLRLLLATAGSYAIAYAAAAASSVLLPVSNVDVVALAANLSILLFVATALAAFTVSGMARLLLIFAICLAVPSVAAIAIMFLH